MDLFKACKNGDREQVDQLIENGTTDWNWGLKGACWSGHLELAKLMVEKGADITRRLVKDYMRCMRLNELIENHLVRVENRKNLFIVDFQRDLMNRTEKYL